jgi:hypothetical protein
VRRTSTDNSESFFVKWVKPTTRRISKPTARTPNGRCGMRTFLQGRLNPLLHASFTQSELVYLLILVANEQPLRAPGADWPNYYAKFFIERYV